MEGQKLIKNVKGNVGQELRVTYKVKNGHNLEFVLNSVTNY